MAEKNLLPQPDNYRPSNEDFHKLRGPHLVPRQLSHSPFPDLLKILYFSLIFAFVKRENNPFQRTN